MENVRRKLIINPTVQAKTNPINPLPKNTGSVAKPGKANEIAEAPVAPAIPPPMAPPIQTKIIGFFSGRFTPNKAGSVTPNIAEIVADKETVFKFLLFVFK